jgi:hypothetical protein
MVHLYCFISVQDRLHDLMNDIIDLLSDSSFSISSIHIEPRPTELRDSSFANLAFPDPNTYLLYHLQILGPDTSSQNKKKMKKTKDENAPHSSNPALCSYCT